MKVKILLNGTMREAEISSDQLLIDFVRDHGCYSVNVDVRRRTAVCVQCL